MAVDPFAKFRVGTRVAGLGLRQNTPQSVQQAPVEVIEEEPLPEEKAPLAQVAKKALMLPVHGVGALGNLLDVPGSMVRDIATWVPGGIPMRNPLDQALPWNWTSSEGRTTERELLESSGLYEAGPGENRGAMKSVGRFVGELGLGIALDPLTYLTAGAAAAVRGGSAAAKGARALSRAGLLDDVADAATEKLSKELGRSVGKGEAMQRINVDDLLDYTRQADVDRAADVTKRRNAEYEVALAQDVNFATPAGAKEAADIGKSKISEGYFRFAPPGMGEYRFGGEKTAKVFDDIYNSVWYRNKAGLRAGQMFDKRVRGATTEETQKQAIREARGLAEDKATALYRIYPAADQTRRVQIDGKFIRDLPQEQQNDIANTMYEYMEDIGREHTINEAGKRVFTPGSLEKFKNDPRFAQLKELKILDSLDLAKQETDIALNRAQSSGTAIEGLDDAFASYASRQKTMERTAARRASDKARYQTTTEAAIRRADYTRDLPGGTAELQRMSIDKDFAGTRDKGWKEGYLIPDAEVEIATDNFAKKYKLKEAGFSDEKIKGLFDSISKRRREDVLANVQMYNNDPIEATVKNLESLYEVAATNRGLGRSMAKTAKLQESVAKQRVAYESAISKFVKTEADRGIVQKTNAALFDMQHNLYGPDKDELARRVKVLSTPGSGIDPSLDIDNLPLGPGPVNPRTNTDDLPVSPTAPAKPGRKLKRPINKPIDPAKGRPPEKGKPPASAVTAEGDQLTGLLSGNQGQLSPIDIAPSGTIVPKAGSKGAKAKAGIVDQQPLTTRPATAAGRQFTPELYEQYMKTVDSWEEATRGGDRDALLSVAREMSGEASDRKPPEWLLSNDFINDMVMKLSRGDNEMLAEADNLVRKFKDPGIESTDALRQAASNDHRWLAVPKDPSYAERMRGLYEQAQEAKGGRLAEDGTRSDTFLLKSGLGNIYSNTVRVDIADSSALQKAYNILTSEKKRAPAIAEEVVRTLAKSGDQEAKEALSLLMEPSSYARGKMPRGMATLLSNVNKEAREFGGLLGTEQQAGLVDRLAAKEARAVAAKASAAKQAEEISPLQSLFNKNADMLVSKNDKLTDNDIMDIENLYASRDPQAVALADYMWVKYSQSKDPATRDGIRSLFNSNRASGSDLNPSSEIDSKVLSDYAFQARKNGPLRVDKKALNVYRNALIAEKRRASAAHGGKKYADRADTARPIGKEYKLFVDKVYKTLPQALSELRQAMDHARNNRELFWKLDSEWAEISGMTKDQYRNLKIFLKYKTGKDFDAINGNIKIPTLFKEWAKQKRAEVGASFINPKTSIMLAIFDEKPPKYVKMIQDQIKNGESYDKEIHEFIRQNAPQYLEGIDQLVKPTEVMGVPVARKAAKQGLVDAPTKTVAANELVDLLSPQAGSRTTPSVAAGNAPQGLVDMLSTPAAGRKATSAVQDAIEAPAKVFDETDAKLLTDTMENVRAGGTGGFVIDVMSSEPVAFNVFEQLMKSGQAIPNQLEDVLQSGARRRRSTAKKASKAKGRKGKGKELGESLAQSANRPSAPNPSIVASRVGIAATSSLGQAIESAMRGYTPAYGSAVSDVAAMVDDAILPGQSMQDLFESNHWFFNEVRKQADANGKTNELMANVRNYDRVAEIANRDGAKHVDPENARFVLDQLDIQVPDGASIADDLVRQRVLDEAKDMDSNGNVFSAMALRGLVQPMHDSRGVFLGSFDPRHYPQPAAIVKRAEEIRGKTYLEDFRGQFDSIDDLIEADPRVFANAVDVVQDHVSQNSRVNFGYENRRGKELYQSIEEDASNPTVQLHDMFKLKTMQAVDNLVAQSGKKAAGDKNKVMIRKEQILNKSNSLGLKQDEIEDLRLQELFADSGVRTAKEVEDWINGHRPKVFMTDVTNDKNITHYENNALAAGDQYREFFARVPDSEAMEVGTFKHFNEGTRGASAAYEGVKNMVAHGRGSVVTGADGKKRFMVHEIQKSDAMQGYMDLLSEINLVEKYFPETAEEFKRAWSKDEFAPREELYRKLAELDEIARKDIDKLTPEQVDMRNKLKSDRSLQDYMAKKSIARVELLEAREAIHEAKVRSILGKKPPANNKWQRTHTSGQVMEAGDMRKPGQPLSKQEAVDLSRIMRQSQSVDQLIDAAHKALGAVSPYSTPAMSRGLFAFTKPVYEGGARVGLQPVIGSSVTELLGVEIPSLFGEAGDGSTIGDTIIELVSRHRAGDREFSSAVEPHVAQDFYQKLQPFLKSLTELGQTPATDFVGSIDWMPESMPFKSSYDEVMFKGILQQAASEGLDGIGIVRGRDIAREVGGDPAALDIAYNHLTKRIGSQLKKIGMGEPAEHVVPLKEKFNSLDALTETEPVSEITAKFWDFDDTTREAAKGVSLYQPTPTGRRAKIQFPPDVGNNTDDWMKSAYMTHIVAYDAADGASYAHEMGHLFRSSVKNGDPGLYQKMEDLFERFIDPKASARRADGSLNWDAQATRWDGKPVPSGYTLEESFADAFMDWIQTGQKVSSGSVLGDLFTSFKEFISSSYNKIKGTKTEDNMSKELNEFFNTLLGPNRYFSRSPHTIKSVMLATGMNNARALKMMVGDGENPGMLDPKQVSQAKEIIYAERVRAVRTKAVQEKIDKGVLNANQVTELETKQLADFKAKLARAQQAGKIPKKINGINTDVSASEILNRFQIPEEIAADMQKVYSYGNKLRLPESWDFMTEMWDGFTNVFKSNVTAIWPAFHARNFFGGVVQNVMNGAYDPFEKGSVLSKIRRSYKDASAAMTGGEISNITKVPRFKGMSEREATDEVLRLAFAHSVIDHQGMHRDLSGVQRSVSEVFANVPGAKKMTDIVKTRAANAEGATKLQQANPFNVAGGLNLGGEVLDKDVFLPARVGRAFGDTIEAGHRLGSFIALIKQGFAPQEAAMRSKLLHVDYRDLTAGEREILRRVIPFYAYTKGMAKYLSQEISGRPGGPTAQLSRAARIAGQRDEATPEHVAAGLSIPLGTDASGARIYMSGLGLMPEDPINKIDSLLGLARGEVGKAFYEVGSNLHPAIKAPLELAFNQSLFQEAPQGGRSLDDMDPPLGRTLSNVGNALGITDRESPYRLGRATEALVSNSPAARYLSTVRNVTNPQKTYTEKALGLLTGMRMNRVSQEQQDRVLKERAESALRDMGGRVFERSYVPDTVRADMSAGDVEQVAAYEQMLNDIAKRTRQRKAILEMQAAQLQ